MIVGNTVAAEARVEPFGERLRRLREERGWGYQELARRMGLQAGTVRNFETRAGPHSHGPTLKTLIVLAQAFGMTVSELIGETDVHEGRTADHRTGA